MPAPRISLEQWQALRAIVDQGGYARAAEALHKSQSTLTYAIQKIESLLGVKVFTIKGRRARLTPAGRLLYQRAGTLLEEAGDLEHAARSLSAGWEAEIRVAVEIVFPTWLLLACLHRFSQESPNTHVELVESVMRGTHEALALRQVDLAIANAIPEGFLGDPLVELRFLAVAHPSHPLHHLGRPVRVADLRAHRLLVVRDTGTTRRKDAVSVKTRQRWTVSTMGTSIQAATMGLGFAWFPEERIREELARGTLAPLPLREGAVRTASLYLIIPDPELAGPGTLRLAQILRETVASECSSATSTPRSRSRSPAPARRDAR